MTPRLNISFPFAHQKAFCWGDAYTPKDGEYLLNHARSGIVMALQAALPQGGRVGVVAYNCYTVANAVKEAGCIPVFVDITADLLIDLQQAKQLDLDAIVATNLFGIHNNIETMRNALGEIPIIVDNAHGYGLPAEGDFTVYSINQGKFPALGEGGILVVNNAAYTKAIDDVYACLPGYSLGKQMKLFASMLIRAWLHQPCIYGCLTMRMKKRRGVADSHETIVLRRMAKGVSRIYQMTLNSISEHIEQQRATAERIASYIAQQDGEAQVLIGDNAFMVVVRTQNIHTLQYAFAQCGIETATHFANSIVWAKQFGYVAGSCPTAEQMTNELLMIPTYKDLKK